MLCDGISKKLTSDQCSNRKGTEKRFYDFGAFRKVLQMLSYDKIIFRLLFDTSLHDTPRIILLYQ